MRLNISFQFSFIIAAAAHLFVFSVFLFVFPKFEAPSRPALIFLGSFLHAQEVAFSSSERSNVSAVVDIRHVNLDIRDHSVPRELNKPSLTGEVTQTKKQQYKPLMAEEKPPVKTYEDPSDLGIDLEPFEPVKLRMER